MLNLTLLGSGGGMPMPNRFLSSLLINYKGRKILMDCGEGTQVAMRKINTGFKSLDIICITHVHGDHIFGLPGLLSTMGNSDRTDPITIIGPEGIEGIIEDMMRVVSYLPYKVNIIENPMKSLNIYSSSSGIYLKEQHDVHNEEIILSTILLEHSAPCLGYSLYLARKPKFIPSKAVKNKVPIELWSRLQAGEDIRYKEKLYYPSMVLGEKRTGIKLSYITDTRPIDTIPKFINGSDLLICEGTYGDNKDMDKAIKNKHMTFSEAAELARKGNVKELLLTHFSPAIDEPKGYNLNAKSIFENSIIGFDGFTKSLSYNR